MGAQRRSYEAWELPPGWDLDDDEPSVRQRHALASGLSRLTGRRHLNISGDTMDVAMAAAAEADAARSLNLWPGLLARLRSLPPDGPYPNESRVDEGYAGGAGHLHPHVPDSLHTSRLRLDAPFARAEPPFGPALIMPFTETLVSSKRLPYKTIVLIWLVLLGTAGGLGLWTLEAEQSGLLLIDVRAVTRRAHSSQRLRDDWPVHSGQVECTTVLVTLPSCAHTCTNPCSGNVLGLHLHRPGRL